MQSDLVHCLISRVGIAEGQNGGYGIGLALLPDGEEYAVSVKLTRWEVYSLAGRMFDTPDGTVLAQLPRSAIHMAERVKPRTSPEMPGPLYDQWTRPLRRPA